MQDACSHMPSYVRLALEQTNDPKMEGPALWQEWETFNFAFADFSSSGEKYTAKCYISKWINENIMEATYNFSHHLARIHPEK